MLKDKMNIIRQLLQDEEEFMDNEREIINLLPEDDSILNLLLEVEDMIAEVAYLEGYKQGLADQIEKRTKESVKDWLILDQLIDIMDGLYGPANKNNLVKMNKAKS